MPFLKKMQQEDTSVNSISKPLESFRNKNFSEGDAPRTSLPHPPLRNVRDTEALQFFPMRALKLSNFRLRIRRLFSTMRKPYIHYVWRCMRGHRERPVFSNKKRIYDLCVLYRHYLVFRKAREHQSARWQASGVQPISSHINHLPSVYICHSVFVRPRQTISMRRTAFG